MQRRIMMRFDDICPTMDWQKWENAEKMLDKYSIRPLLGVVPDCKDPKLQIMQARKDYWTYLKELENKGYVLAMHGYEHLYDNRCRGMINNGIVSEFAGHSYETQYEKIYKGKQILNKHGIETDIFFAPSHSYDCNTLRALYDCGFRYISDGRTNKIVVREGIMCVPSGFGSTLRLRKNGLYTAVFHINEWNENIEIGGVKAFTDLCENHYEELVDFRQLVKEYDLGNIWIESTIERSRVIYERYFRPVLSRFKQKFVKRCA